MGSLSETVLVTGTAPVLQTENASVGMVVGSRDGTGVVAERPQRAEPDYARAFGRAARQQRRELTGKNVFAAGNYQIGGGTANQSASYFDGVPVQDSAYGNIVVLTPSPDSVAEFRVQTNNSSAEFGRFTGGVINIASRSGTNTFRGSPFEFHRNRALNSNTFFGERAGLDRPPFVQNNFGGSLGGPVLKRQAVLLREITKGTATAKACSSAAPCPRSRCGTGIFRITGTCRPALWCRFSIRGRNAASTILAAGAYNGDCGVVPNRSPIPANIIPANRISPIARKLMDFPNLRQSHRVRPLGSPTITSGTSRPAWKTINTTSAPTTT